ncbi:MAG: OmpA family protein [Magnetococcales bacterium]|nr:OmpA family protein [Magnetococcales bacterium]
MAGTQCYFCKETPDCDRDGVEDKKDKCPTTPYGNKVDKDGCGEDSDGDGVPDIEDKCPGTPKGVKVNADGCPLDSDGDGVYDYLDKCPGTPAGVTVDTSGCPIDTDGDGVADYLDRCPGTPAGVDVDVKGCPLDKDGDGVLDYMDKCLGTPKGATVNELGCWVLKGVHFSSGSAAIQGRYHGILNQVARVLRNNAGVTVQVEGHTDNVGNSDLNKRLSDRRAQSVRRYLVNRGISSNRLSAVGYGMERPIASNESAAGRASNRRVELTPIQ